MREEDIMRIAGLVAALMLSGGVTAGAVESIDVTAVTPASVEVTLWCARFPDAICRHAAGGAARAHCRTAGAKARFVRSALLQRTFTKGQLGFFLYDCVH
jgi:hypothetical protein